MHLFHYHLVTSKVRQVEARYLGKLGFDLVARHFASPAAGAAGNLPGGGGGAGGGSPLPA